MARDVGFPLVVRPSYVLGGRAMEVVFNEDDLRQYMIDAVKVSNDSPVLLDRFLDLAIEVDVDAVSDGENVLIGGIMEHIEQAGVHSGDSGLLAAAERAVAGNPGGAARPDAQARQGAERGRLDERPVRDPERRHLHPGGQPSRLADGAVRLQGHRHSPREGRRPRHDRQIARRAGTDGRARAALLLGQRGRVPVHQVPRGRPDPGTRDEIHGRSHGHGEHVRGSVCQGAGGLRGDPADARDFAS